ncbi:MAG TPA: sodium ABC transporter ATP-binding protein, partial [Firmicutes bacterium]|nr:sodium ABC transporter ATP-binding protein [Bacillota bacterium]
MIEVKNVSKKFQKKINKKEKQEFYADVDISFTAKEGEIVGILGPNGAGKTTLLRMLAGIMIPTSGSIKIDDKNYQDNPNDIKREIAYLSGNTKLYKDISPYELLSMCASYYDVPKNEIESRIKTISEELNMTSFLHQRIENLSTGQMQRVNISRCIIHNPKYYILDEATSGLDIISSKTILDFIKEEKIKNKGIIYSTHYMEEAENICDRVILIHNGKIIKEG